MTRRERLRSGSPADLFVLMVRAERAGRPDLAAGRALGTILRRAGFDSWTDSASGRVARLGEDGRAKLDPRRPGKKRRSDAPPPAADGPAGIYRVQWTNVLRQLSARKK